MRVLVAGMGSAIGTNVALRLVRDEALEAIAGFDLEPPRRYIPGADFQSVSPLDSHRVHEIVQAFKPTVVVHAWVFEPRARSSPGQARTRTLTGTEALLGAIAKLDTVERIIVRSTASIYGRGRTSPDEPTVETEPRPTTTFGTMAAAVEERVDEVGHAIGATVANLRLGPVMSSNLPNPLGRFLRLPAVPTPVTSHRFGVAHLGDVVRIMSKAATMAIDGPVNVMAAGPVTPWEAVTIGRRLPIPVLPGVFRTVRNLTDIIGSPVPEHVAELLTRGGVIEPTDTDALLGVPMRRTTRAAIEDLYATGRIIDVDVARLVRSR